MNILSVEQGSTEWLEARRCRVTGTKLDAVMGTPSARRALIAELIAEEATEQSKILIPTAEMERGSAEEIFAIKAFEARTGKRVARVGLCVSEKYPWLALSPDGLIATGADDNIKYTEACEVKSPDSKKAILYRIENMVPPEETGLMGAKGNLLASAPFLGVPSDYKWQIVNYFLNLPDLEILHFIVYDARFIADDMKLYVVEVRRSNEILQEAIAEAEAELERFRADWLRWKEIVLPSGF